MSKKRTPLPAFAPVNHPPPPSLSTARTPLPDLPGFQPINGAARQQTAPMSAYQQQEQSIWVNNNLERQRGDEAVVTLLEDQNAEVALQKAAMTRLKRYERILQGVHADPGSAFRTGYCALERMVEDGVQLGNAIVREGRYQQSVQNPGAPAADTYRARAPHGHGHNSPENLDHEGLSGHEYQVIIGQHAGQHLHPPNTSNDSTQEGFQIVDHQKPAANVVTVQNKKPKVGPGGARSEYVTFIKRMYARWEQGVILDEMDEKEISAPRERYLGQDQLNTIIPAPQQNNHQSTSPVSSTIQHAQLGSTQFQSGTISPTLPENHHQPTPPDSSTVQHAQFGFFQSRPERKSDVELAPLTHPMLASRQLPALPELSKYLLNSQYRPTAPQNETLTNISNNSMPSKETTEPLAQTPQSQQDPFLTVEAFKNRQQFLDGMSIQREFFAIDAAQQEERIILWQSGFREGEHVQEYYQELFDAQNGQLWEHMLNEVCDVPHPKIAYVLLSPFEKEWKLRRLQRHKKGALDIERERMPDRRGVWWIHETSASPPEPRLINQLCKFPPSKKSYPIFVS